MSKKKVVLAYSGGLDTSIMIPWLKENYDCDVIAMCANLGQADELTGLEEKALKTGASKVYIEDLRQEFIANYIYPTLRSGAKFEREYLLGTSFGRPLIAKRQVEIAAKEGATLVAHGATGKGNDQVRFELTYMALNPELQIIAPWKDPKWNLNSREACIEYAESRNVPISQSKKRIYSEDRNIWHISHEGGNLENPGQEPDADVYTLSKTLEMASERPEYVEIEFEKAIPVAINGKRLGDVELVETLNRIGAEHAIGQLDLVENRLVGIKSRGIYETPGGTILYAALRQIEQLVLDRDTLREKDKLAITYADLVYDGRWFTPLRESLDAFYTHVHASSTGKVRLKLYKGNVVPAGTWADKSLYLEDLASFTDTPLFDQKDSTGFLRIYGLPMKVRGLVYRR
jgi:argininosuccinate synthase